MQIPAIVSMIVHRIAAAGGQTLLVGGAVGDLILGRQPKDYDLEVFGLDGEKLVVSTDSPCVQLRAGSHSTKSVNHRSK